MTEQADLAEMTQYKPEMLSSYELGSMEMADPVPNMALEVVREPSKSERAIPSPTLDLQKKSGSASKDPKKNLVEKKNAIRNGMKKNNTRTDHNTDKKKSRGKP